MKKIICTVIYLMGFLHLGIAQTNAEKLFQQTITDYQKNPLKAVTEGLSENYVLISGSGNIASKSQVVALFKNVKSIDVSFKDLKVRQIGNTVIATGNEHDVRHYNDGTPDLSIDYLSTYIYEIKGKKLIGVNGQHTYPALGDKQAEEENIKIFVRQETIDALEGKSLDQHFVDDPSTFRVWNIRSGAHETDYGLADMRIRTAKYFSVPRKMNPDNDKYNFQWLGDNAVIVSYDQYLYGRNSPPSKEVRILKRVNGEWKISGLMAFTNYTAHKFEQDNVRKTIDAETNAYNTGDVEAMNKQWGKNVNYLERQQALLKNRGLPAYVKGDDLQVFVDQLKKSQKPTGQTYEISDYEAHVGPTNAWVTYTQNTFNADGKVASKTREMRILERLDGWKIVALSNVEL